MLVHVHVMGRKRDTNKDLHLKLTRGEENNLNHALQASSAKMSKLEKKWINLYLFVYLQLSTITLLHSHV